MSQQIKYTMRDVARVAGVSVSTVSAVLNETVKVSPQRVALVRAAMRTLDYHPDQVARSLKTGKSKVVGVIVPDIVNTFYPAIIRGVESAAADAGYDVLLCDSNEDPVAEQKHLGTLFSRRVDGVLLACCLNSTARAAIVRRSYPVVFVDRLPESPIDGTVCTDNFQAGYMATRYLAELGHRRIGLLAGHQGLSPHRDRLEGFRKAMQEFHLMVRDEYLSYGEVQIRFGYDAAKLMLTLDVPPTAIIASNNPLTLGLVKAMNELKIACPGRLSVLGFDDFAWNESFSPPITTVNHPAYEAGKRSFEMLIRMIDSPGEDFALQKILLPTELLIRESTAPPHPDHRTALIAESLVPTR